MTLTTKTFYDEQGRSAAELSVKSLCNRNASCVELEISGAILSENADDFREFITEISRYPGTVCRLHLQDLKILSTRGFRALVKLAKTVRRRGHRVEIMSIDPIVFYLMRENRLDKYFSFGQDKKVLLNRQRFLFSSFCMN